MRSGALRYELRHGLQRARGQAAAIWTEPVVTGRCEVCARLAYDRDRLCPVCVAELSYVRLLRSLGYSTETAESRALHAWLRRQERRETLYGLKRGLRKLGGILWALGVTWALLYIGWQFGAMFLGWIWR